MALGDSLRAQIACSQGRASKAGVHTLHAKEQDWDGAFSCLTSKLAPSTINALHAQNIDV
eukprot:1159005-Pelagomonas_calceolata.AAC.2